MKAPRVSRIASLWDLCLAPGTLWWVAFFIVPMAIVVAVSFASQDLVNRPVYGWHPENFRYAVDPIYLRVLLRSLIYALVTTALCLAVGYPVAYTIARFGGRYRNLLIGMVVLPWLVDYLVRIYAWVVILGNNGIINGVLRALGMHGNPPLQMTGTWVAVILGLIYSYFPLMVLPLYATIVKIDASVIHAAKDLYATPAQAFVRVTLPLTTPGIVAGCILVFLPCVGDFATAKLLGGPGQYMMGSLISDQFMQSGAFTFGAALTVVMLSIMWLAIIAFVIYSAKKGQRGLGVM